MTATPDKRDDDQDGKNVYEIFHYQIAYEIRFAAGNGRKSYFVRSIILELTSISSVMDEALKAEMLRKKNFNMLTSDERVRHVIEQAEYYGYSGDRVKGLVFCSRSRRNAKNYRAKFNALRISHNCT